MTGADPKRGRVTALDIGSGGIAGRLKALGLGIYRITKCGARVPYSSGDIHGRVRDALVDSLLDADPRGFGHAHGVLLGALREWREHLRVARESGAQK